MTSNSILVYSPIRGFRELKKQLDFRWRQLDRFETSVKNLVDVKHTWRRKYNGKEGELEAAKVCASFIYAWPFSDRR